MKIPNMLLQRSGWPLSNALNYPGRMSTSDISRLMGYMRYPNLFLGLHDNSNSAGVYMIIIDTLQDAYPLIWLLLLI